MRRFLAAAAIVATSATLSLLALELILRAATGTLSEWRNYATEPLKLVNASQMLRFDPELGWALKEERPDLGLGPLGNRLHRPAAEAQLGAPILAIGDSFTYGSEVGPDESWPAQLEQKVGATVINAGVGGYGIDQMVMNAERLVPRVKPRLVLFSFIPPDITRVGMSIFSGAAKPFFHLVDGRPEAQNLPLAPYQPTASYVGQLRATLGYSYLIDWTAARLGLTSAWRSSRFEHRHEKVDAIALSCAFMDRLAKLPVPVIIISQHGFSDFVPAGFGAVEQQNRVLDCARDAGMKVIETYGALRAMLPETYDAKVYSRLYVNGGGHMTPEGNALVADLISKEIEAAK